MTKKFAILVVGLLAACGAYAQQVTKNETGKYWVYFNDKGPEARTILANYRDYLPKAMVEAHEKRGMAINADDLPVSKTYYGQLVNAGYKVTGSSRWLNAVIIDADQLDETAIKVVCPAVQSIQRMATILPMSQLNPMPELAASKMDSIPYGKSTIQNKIIGMECLQENGYTGSGVKIAVLDASFRYIDVCPSFDFIHNNNLIKARFNLVDSTTNIDGSSGGHGTMVTSVISAYNPDSLMGIAYGASLYLAVAEEARAPYHDIIYVNAVEWADEQGVDIIQSSLGYIYPPNPSDTGIAAGLQAYTYANLNGHGTPITRAAQKAAGKGMLFVNAVGDPFFGNIIFAPSDGDSVLAVGGVNTQGKQSSSATYQRTVDGRMKPDVDALASSVYITGYNNTCTIQVQQGSSLSAPAITGMAACLKQAHPTASNWLISQAIKYSSAFGPMMSDTMVAFGTANGCRADSLLSLGWTGISETTSTATGLNIYPVPTDETLTVSGITNFAKAQVCNVIGQVMNVNYSTANNEQLSFNTANLQAGIYLITIIDRSGNTRTGRFIKQ